MVETQPLFAAHLKVMSKLFVGNVQAFSPAGLDVADQLVVP